MGKLNILHHKNGQILKFPWFALDFRIFHFLMVLWCFCGQIQILWRVLLPGDGPRSFWDRVKKVSWPERDVDIKLGCLSWFFKSKGSGAIASWNLAPRPDCSFYILVSMSEADLHFGWIAKEHKAKHPQKLEILVAKRGLGAQGGLLKLAAQRLRIIL